MAKILKTKLFLLLALGINWLVASHKDFRIYQNMTCDGFLPGSKFEIIHYWSIKDPARRLYYKKIMQAVLLGASKSSARWDDEVSRGNILLIRHLEKDLSADLKKTLAVLKGAPLPARMDYNQVQVVFNHMVNLATWFSRA